MSEFSLDTSQLSRLAESFRTSPDRVRPLVQRVVDKTTADTEADARKFSPVDTGNLRASIFSELGDLTGRVSASANYAEHVEFGTSTQGPAAFIGPAFDRNVARLVPAMSAVTVKGLL